MRPNQNRIFLFRLPNFRKIFPSVGDTATLLDIQSGHVSQELYCFGYCLVKQRTVCIINIYGYTEILPVICLTPRGTRICRGHGRVKSCFDSELANFDP